MLLALGGEDRRVPSSQGIKYYRTLKAAGKDVRFVDETSVPQYSKSSFFVVLFLSYT